MKKNDLLDEIRSMYNLQTGSHKKEIEHDIFEAIDWVGHNMPDELSKEDIDSIADRYKFNGEILNAIDDLE
jgi:hypothetical protein